MKKLFLLLIFIFSFSLLPIIHAQEQPKDLEIKVIPLSDEDSKQTEQLYNEYQEAIKKWGEHKGKLRDKYLADSVKGSVLSFSSYGWSSGYSYELPYFVVSKDYKFLIVTKESDHSSWVNWGSVTPATMLTPLTVHK